VCRIGIVLGLAVAGAVAAATVALAGGTANARPSKAPPWARPLVGVRPYSVARNYGTSRGLTCDLKVFTTNPAALDGKARLRPGDVTATVCVVRRAGS